MATTATAPPESGGTIRPSRPSGRYRLTTRLWHWVNAIAIFVLLMSGLMIFNAHPRLYWGEYGANADPAWLAIGATGPEGHLDVGSVRIETTGLLGLWRDSDGNLQRRAFPGWATIPSYYSLSSARRWHLAFAWVFAVGLLVFMVVSFATRHAQRDLAPTRDELTPRRIWHDIKQHARFRFDRHQPDGSYNILQKLSYFGVIFLLLPLLIFTGLTMSPALNAAWPWMLDLFGGRQSARSLHFIAAALTVLFILVHVVLVIVAGSWSQLRAMIIGPDRTPREAA